jgi:hypothetical protein
VVPPQDSLQYHLEVSLSIHIKHIEQHAESNVDTVHISVKSCIISMASMSKHLNEENVLDILNESDECLINDSSGDTDDCEDDIAVPDSAVDEENSEVEEEGQVHSLGDANYNRGYLGGHRQLSRT